MVSNKQLSCVYFVILVSPRDGMMRNVDWVCIYVSCAVNSNMCAVYGVLRVYLYITLKYFINVYDYHLFAISSVIFVCFFVYFFGLCIV
jgi:hypothetical protein